MIIAFDLDGIFIGSPPFVPKRLIEWLYRGPQNQKLKYRYPTTKFEQQIRKLSHLGFLRPSISKNAEFLKNFSKSDNQIYLVSSRYQFLESLTLKLLEKYSIKNNLTKIYLNTENEQPHLFKEKMIKKLKINIFIDDDLKLLMYLRSCCPDTKLFFYDLNPKQIGPGVNRINELTEIKKYIK